MMGHCPICGEEIDEIRVNTSKTKFVCPSCNKVICNDPDTAGEVLRMSELEAQTIKTIREENSSLREPKDE